MANVRVRNLSDEDLHALIAYLRSQPPVVNETQDPPDQPSFLAMLMLGAGLLPEGQPPITGVITAPPKGPTVEYGQYLLNYQDCRGCHGEDLTGGTEGQLAPVGPSLRVVKGWTQEQFLATLRAGVDPGGNVLSDQMPWKALGRMDDEDLMAMYAYLTSLP
jgi:mono/diheme cytochrome c family protein